MNINNRPILDVLLILSILASVVGAMYLSREEIRNNTYNYTTTYVIGGCDTVTKVGTAYYEGKFNYEVIKNKLTNKLEVGYNVLYKGTSNIEVIGFDYEKKYK